MYAGAVARDTHGLHQGLIQSGIALAIMTVVSIALGWLVAGRVLRPLRTMTATTRQISERNLNERLALSGPRDELKDLADTVDGLLARLEAHVAEQQRFAANASHELRTPLAITQTLLDVARNDPNRDNGELVDRLHAVNTRAIDLTEALLLLSRADQRSFTREHVDLSLIAEEATETLLPLAEEHGVTIETSGDMTPTIGSHALLLQMSYEPRAQRDRPQPARTRHRVGHDQRSPRDAWCSPSRTPARSSRPQLVSTLAEPFQRGTNAYAPTTQASASAWRSSRASPKHTTAPSPSPPGPPAGSASRCNYPPRHRSMTVTMADRDLRPRGRGATVPPRLRLGRLAARIPDDFPQMPVGIPEIAGVDAPGALMWFVGERRTGLFCAGEQGVHFSFAGDQMADAELAGFRWPEIDAGVLGQLSSRVEREDDPRRPAQTARSPQRV